jgi:hypothetical protein
MAGVPLRQAAQVIRSKNAGPYELTLDVIFPSEELYERVREARIFTPEAVAARYNIPVTSILKVVHYDPARAVKITLARPLVSGAIGETDVYGAQQHAPLLELEIPATVVGPDPVR